MPNFIFGLVKFVISIGLLAIAFWPNGLGSMIVANFDAAPIPFTILSAVWGILLALNLPLTRVQFTKTSSLCLIVIFIAISFLLYQNGKLDLADKGQWAIMAIVYGGTLLGWLPNASKIWRAYRGVYGVDDADTGGEE